MFKICWRSSWKSHHILLPYTSFSLRCVVYSPDMSTVSLDTIAALAKRRGFVYPTSEIYGGLGNSYDYGPLGTELMRNIRNLWWKRFIQQRADMVGLDSSIILHPQTWVASGHVASFTDPMVEDLVTNKRYRADHLIEAWIKDHPETGEGLVVEKLKTPDMAKFIADHKVLSPDGNAVSAPKDFNILFETAIGAVSGEKSVAYLRGETAQGIFSNFKQVLNSNRVKLPFGIGQIGKSFRNEITLGQFVFRTLEFEQAEIEYFFDPESTQWEPVFENWKNAMWSFITKDLGVAEDNLRWRVHNDEERSHYSQRTEDLDYKFPFGFKELWGIAYRTDYDLNQHIKHSGQDLSVVDSSSGRKFVPHVIEPALGVNRAFLMVLCNSYWEDTERQRTVLKLPFGLAPYKVAVFPLLKNKPELVAKAEELYNTLLPNFATVWDDRGNIGKRYLSQDEVGTPVCLTIDFQTLEDGTVTWRDRDTAQQERIAISEVPAKLAVMAL